jgi:hypothetical protein
MNVTFSLWFADQILAEVSWNCIESHEKCCLVYSVQVSHVALSWVFSTLNHRRMIRRPFLVTSYGLKGH